MQIKRMVYLLSASVLGFLLQLITHALIEMWYINLLLNNFARWNFGFSWDQLWQIHHALSTMLVVVGIAGGYMLGVIWWRIIYIEKRYWWRKR
ncbi:MAG: hypothetical protein AAB417_01205 [Patescibacteria group bacterium]